MRIFLAALVALMPAMARAQYPSPRVNNLTIDGTVAVASPSGVRTSLGLGTIATQNSNAVTITGGTMSGATITSSMITTGLGYTPLRPSLNLSDVSSTSTVRTNLGLGTMATQAASAVAITGGTIAGVSSITSAGNVALSGTISGTVTQTVQAAAGTFNFNLPTTAGSSGQVLTSAGGVAAPMTWTNRALIYDINVKNSPYNAVGDGKTLKDGVFSNGSAQLDSATAAFTAASVGKWIEVNGWNGPGAAPFVGTIATYVSPTRVTLSAAATASGPLSYLGYAPPPTVGGTTGSYKIGDLLPIVGGTFTVAAQVKVNALSVRTVTINNAGSGGIDGTYTIKGTSGSSQFQTTGTITGGVLTAVTSTPSIRAGFYVADPASLAAEPVTDLNNVSGLVGATVTITMNVASASLSVGGVYTVVPVNPAATGAGSLSGATGSTFALSWNSSGTFIYGTDDSAAFAAAITASIAAWNAGKQQTVYVPGATYIIGNTAMPLFASVPGSIKGDGSSMTRIIKGSEYPGTFLFGWSESWAANGAQSPSAPVTSAGTIKWGPRLVGLSIYGNRLAPAAVDAVGLYDRIGNAYVSDVQIDSIRGHGIVMGLPKALTVGYISESVFKDIRVSTSGDTGKASILMTSGGDFDTTNEIDMTSINIFGSYGPGMVIAGQASQTISAVGIVRINGLRIEGLQQNFANKLGHLLQIGDTGQGGFVYNVNIDQATLIDPANGYAALFIDSGIGATKTYGINIRGDIGGGAPLGKGVVVANGRVMNLFFQIIYTWDKQITVNASAGDSILFAGSVRYLDGIAVSIDPTEYSQVFTPVNRYINSGGLFLPKGEVVFGGPLQIIGASSAIVRTTGITDVTLPVSGTLATFVTVPASSTVACRIGDISADASYIYACRATNLWTRAANVGGW